MSFGYDSNFMARTASSLGIADFARDLLCAIDCSPALHGVRSPIVFVAHSLGGLVVKEACVLASKDPGLATIFHRIEAVVFLATVHARGLGLPLRALNNILRALSLSRKPYISELNTSSIEMTSYKFRLVADGLRIVSFYETLPTKLGHVETVSS